MAKIHILGGPGSGKSTLAHELSIRLNIPHYDLDILGQKHGSDPEPYIEDAISIARMPGWVVEGIYILTIDPLLYEADYIVLLDITWPVAGWRIVKRHVIKTLRGTNQYPGLRTLVDFLGYARNYYLNRPLDKAEMMRVCLREHREMALPPARETMVAFLDTYHEVSIPPTAEFVRMYLEKHQDKVCVVQNNADRRRLIERIMQP